MNQTVKVWDPLVRIFHWTLVAAFATAWLTAEEWDAQHRWAGYVILALVGFRLLWGVIGPTHARFGNFLTSPSVTARYLVDLVCLRERPYVGHNPAGAWMIVALLLSLLATATTGLLSEYGPSTYAQVAGDLHEGLAELTIILVGAHVAGVIWASLRHQENLICAMFHGRKKPIEKDV